MKWTRWVTKTLAVTVLALSFALSVDAGDWSKPQLTDTYANFLSYLNGRLNDAVMFMDATQTSPTNVPHQAKRWNPTTSTFQVYSGASPTWRDLTPDNAHKVDGFHAAQSTAASQIPVYDSDRKLLYGPRQLRLLGSANGATNFSYIEFTQNDSTVLGSLGDGSSTDNNIVLSATNNLYLSAVGGTDDPRVSKGGSSYAIWHAGNDGAASGLDADLFDGQSSAHYLTATNITSGTLPDAQRPTGVPYARHESGLRIIRGSIAANGSTTVGSGFSCVKNSTGNYTITFTNAFSAQPTVTVSQNTSTGAGSINQGSTTPTTTLDVNVYDSTPALSDRAFTFIAIGPN